MEAALPGGFKEFVRKQNKKERNKRETKKKRRNMKEKKRGAHS